MLIHPDTGDTVMNSLHREYLPAEFTSSLIHRNTHVTESTILTRSKQLINLDRVPVLERMEMMGTVSSVFESDPDGLAAVQFRVMQRRLMNLREDGGSLLITSPGPDDGKSLTAHNLAWALAEAGSPTLLLELDLRRPSQARRFGSKPTTGVVEVLTGKVSPLSALRRIDGISLGFIGAEMRSKDPTGLLRSSALSDLLTWARSAFTWVVIDAPPVLPVADVDDLLPRLDLVAMVIRERWTPRTMTQRAAEHLGSRLNFLILNDTDLSTVEGYRYGYQ